MKRHERRLRFNRGSLEFWCGGAGFAEPCRWLPRLRAEDADAAPGGACRAPQQRRRRSASLPGQPACWPIRPWPTLRCLREPVSTPANDGRAEIQFEDGSVARISPAELAHAVRCCAGLAQTPTATRKSQLNGGLAYFEIQGDGDIQPHAGSLRRHCGDRRRIYRGPDQPRQGTRAK